MGGGDLNMKKSWHTGTFANQERVWKKEREALEERKKLQQLQKELEQERAVQELQRLQEAAGGKTREQRVDWLYAAPAEGSGPNPDELEAYLLGKKRVDQLLKGNEEKLLAAPTNDSVPGGSFQSLQSANTARDTASKIREDPLLAIKRQEQLQYEKMLKDPRKRRELREARAMAASSGATPGPGGGVNGSSSSRNGGEAGESKEERRARREARRAERASRHTEDDAAGRRDRRRDHREDDRRSTGYRPRRHHDDDYGGDDHSSSRRHHRNRSRSPRRSSNDYYRDRDPHRGGERREPIYRDDYPDSGRSRSYRSTSHTAPRSPPGRDREDWRGPPPPPVAPPRDRPSYPPREPIHDSRRSNGSSAPAIPSAAVRTAADPRAEEDRKAALAARLAAMQSSAASLSATRAERLVKLEAEDAVEIKREEEERKKRGDVGPRFLSEAQGKVFGGGMDLAERMKRSGRVGMVGDRDD